MYFRPDQSNCGADGDRPDGLDRLAASGGPDGHKGPEAVSLRLI